MANKVILNKNNLIEQNYIGNQDFKSVMSSASQTMVLLDKLRDIKVNARVIVNVSGIKKITADALLAGAEGLNILPDTKIAVFGGSKLINDLANLVITAVGKESSVMVFDKKSDAVRWLLKK